MVKKPVRTIAREEAKKVINSNLETKNFYARQNPLGVSFSGQVFQLLQNPALPVYLVQGATKNDYIGDTISPVGLYINYNCVTTLTTVNTYNNFRIMVVQVIGGGTPSAGNVLQSVSNVMTPYSHYDANYKETFRVLYDKNHVCFANEKPIVNGKIYIPAKKLRKIYFLANTALNVTAGNLFLVAYTDSAVTTFGYVGYQSRLAFKDA